MEGGRGGLYGSWFNDKSYLEAQLGGGGCHYGTKRAALEGFASGHTESYELDSMLGGGYDLKHRGFILGMLAEMHYIYVDMDAFTESGSMSPLQIQNNDSQSLWTLLGTRLAYEWPVARMVLRPELQLGWRHEFLDVTRAIDSRMASGAGAVFQVESPSLGRDSLSLVAGLSTRCTQHLSVFAYYASQLARNNCTSHTMSGGISLDF